MVKEKNGWLPLLHINLVSEGLLVPVLWYGKTAYLQGIWCRYFQHIELESFAITVQVWSSHTYLTCTIYIQRSVISLL